MTELPSLALRRAGGVPYVEIAHPPMNLVDSNLSGQLAELATALERDADTRAGPYSAGSKWRWGLPPGGAGTQNLPALVGRARALEVILGGADVDADLAERCGWINRALPHEELAGFVDTVAMRIASHGPTAQAQVG